jgi:hypothetical protein
VVGTPFSLLFSCLFAAFYFVAGDAYWALAGSSLSTKHHAQNFNSMRFDPNVN